MILSSASKYKPKDLYNPSCTITTKSIKFMTSLPMPHAPLSPKNDSTNKLSTPHTRPWPSSSHFSSLFLFLVPCNIRPPNGCCTSREWWLHFARKKLGQGMRSTFFGGKQPLKLWSGKEGKNFAFILHSIRIFHFNRRKFSSINYAVFCRNIFSFLPDFSIFCE